MNKTILFSILIITFSSCGLKYEPQVLPEDRQLQRQRVIEASIIEDFSKENKKYESIAFGQSTTVKPLSFLKLDSLYEKRYELELVGRKDRQLEEEIEVQKMICVTDTNEVLYVENHIFSLTRNDSTQILSGRFALNANNDIRDVQLDDFINVPKELMSLYKIYIFQESFMYPGYAAEARDLDFYKIYKPKVNSLTGVEKEEFVTHMLQVMKIAQNRKTVETSTLLKDLTRNKIHGVSKDYKDEVFHSIDQLEDEKKNIVGYVVRYQVSITNLTGSFSPIICELKFDSWLKLTESKSEKIF